MLVPIYWRLRDNQLELKNECMKLEQENKALQEALRTYQERVEALLKQ